MASITLDAERRVRADAGRVRIAAVDALRSLGFQVTSEQATVVEARRGSVVRSAMLLPDEVPLAARLQFAAAAAADGNGTTVAVHLTDRAVSVVALGVQSPYVTAYQNALFALDRALTALDPDAATDFPQPRWWTSAPQAETLARHHQTGQRVVGGVTAMINDRLSGTPRRTGPSLWSGVQGAVFHSRAGVLGLDHSALAALLAIPVMMSSRPDGVPEQLGAGVARLAAEVEGCLAAVGFGVVDVRIGSEQRPVFEFLYRQFGIRSQLPVRTLCTCRDCRQTKVVNLDLQRMRERRRRLKLITTVVRAGHGKNGEINPFAMIGAFLQQGKVEPDFICSRCESTAADEHPVTFCPGCGDMRTEGALISCGECGYDFEALVAGLAVWGAAPPPVPPVAPVAPPPPVAPLPPVAPPRPAVPPMPAVAPIPAPPTEPPVAPPAAPPGFGPPPEGFTPPPPPTCGICGGSYPVLWSVQVLDGANPRPLTVCRTSPHCSPPSVIAPVRMPS
ncbi:hypothetical protein ACFY2K_09370 [Kitasatospora sp. NPDC001309]|uniref:hypothetical protein n=1 Tax=Kitasatospora sp. NPDC001309 TaxID=3364013 RepID=UPI0036CEE838